MSGELVFAVNGVERRVAASDVHPRTTLNEYLRESGLTGVKVSCSEGGCGACAVALSRTVDGKEETISVNSCLRPLSLVEGWNVVTPEGLTKRDGRHGAFTKDDVHPIQARVAGFNGSQCGFCTPGMVMTAYAKLHCCGGGKDTTMKDLEDAFDGNICRCTGYRPILDAVKSFASDSNVVDKVSKTETDLGAYDISLDPQVPEFLGAHKAGEFRAESHDGQQWVRANSLAHAFTALATHGADARLVVANTSVGIYKNDAHKVFVSVGHLAELNGIETTSNGVSAGAAVSIARLISHVESERATQAADKVRSFEPLVTHWRKIANVHIRNAGSIGGNLVMAKTRAFASDLATTLAAAGASVTLVKSDGSTRDIGIDEFLTTPTFVDGEILQRVHVPFSTSATHLRTYRAAQRPRNSHAVLNAGFSGEWDASKKQLTSLRVVYGAVAAHSDTEGNLVVAERTAAALVGKPLTDEVIATAVAAANDEVQPRGYKVDYRRGLVGAFVFKYVASLVGDDAAEAVRSISHVTERENVVSSHQSFKYADTHAPVSEPIHKYKNKNFGAGNARFTDDFPVQRGQLFAAIVASTEARAKLVSVDASEALKQPGVTHFISAKDIKGVNNAAPGQLIEVFAGDQVVFHNQPIGLVLATTQRAATEAARLVKVELDTEGKKPVITIEDARAAGEEYATPVVNKHESGDVDDALKADGFNVSKGQVAMGSQMHFYMEPVAVDVDAEEDGQINVRTGMQWPDFAHAAIAGVLALPFNQVHMINRRAGGGFGGRITNFIIHACAAAVAAQATGKSVRYVLDRNDDMATCGGREEVLGDYEVAYNDDGKIHALKYEFTLNSGHMIDLSWFANMVVPAAVCENYKIDHFLYSSTLVRSNIAARTAVRGPGDIQAVYLMEQVIERIAHELGKDPHEVRETNFYPAEGEFTLPNGHPLAHYTVPEMWADLKKRADLDGAVKAVDEFNRTHRYKKRGVSQVPIRYGVGVWPKSAIVNILADGSVQVHHGACDVGQGLHVKVAQVVSYELGKLLGSPLPLESIRFKDYDSSVVPNQTFTGGSTGSEGAAAACAEACQKLVASLEPFVEQVREENEKNKKEGEDAAPVSWAAIAGKAAANFPGQPIPLIAVGQWTNHGDDALLYDNYGVAQSIVEVDVLTGETKVLKSHLIYDCGKSLNPAIDMGQAEGAFMMGLGFMSSEEVVYDSSNGALISNGTWEYKPPLAGQLPEEFTVEFLEETRFEKGILSSKASGEPPLKLAVTVGLAIQNAIHAARKDGGVTEFAHVPAPYTPEVIQQFAKVEPSRFSLS